MIKKITIFIILVISAIALNTVRSPRKETKNPLFSEERVLLGTFVKVISPSDKAAEIAFREIERIEGLLSKYKPESEVYRLNKTGKIKASPETFFIIKRAKEFYALSNGAFDITLGPLVDLWGFTEKNYRVPHKKDLNKALNLVGSDKIILREEDNVIQFLLPGMKIDLGAIAKGYAVDCAIEKLKKAGIKDCLINAGGQVYCLGKNYSKPWRVSIRNPGGGKKNNILELRDKAVSTSGIYEQNFIKESTVYGHIINPKTGMPVENSLLSVTIVTGNSLDADALSTAIFILGGKTKALTAAFKDTQAIIIKKIR